MVFKFLTVSEDPDNPLLGTIISLLRCGGLWEKDRLKNFLHNLVHFVAFIFVLSQYVELWVIRNDLEMAMRNLSLTMLSTVCVFKACNLVFWQNTWKELFDYVSELERSQLAKKDDTINKIIFQYVKYARRVTYLYWSLVTATVLIVSLAPLLIYWSSPTYRHNIRNGTLPYPEIMSSWTPFDRTRGIGFCVATVYQMSACVYGGIVVANFDSTAVVIMTFFAGQLKVLSANCSRLFGDGNELINYDETVKRIRECHLHHLYLVKFSAVLNSLLSPVMFLYVIICSLMICASAAQLTTEGTTTVHQIFFFLYLMALIAQLFLYCWHSNDVFFLSNQVDDGVYSSAWWSQNVRTRRSLLLLGGQLRKPIVFTAGPFTKLNMATFVTILKGSYSYYTLVAKKED
ncbi:odorant receptor Or2-like [Spodoptera litura]|uniref:Odorant receptor n=1 Tax=Spodoptera litura TaxID=69820 RepID=A0A9J7IHS4_SPOLT|nr:odorant receptor Or2-like [Spodoptera litura]